METGTWPELPLYGYSEDALEAIDNLRNEVEDLFEELVESDDFSEEWLGFKRFLQAMVIN